MYRRKQKNELDEEVIKRKLCGMTMKIVLDAIKIVFSQPTGYANFLPA